MVDILLAIHKEIRGPHPSLWLASQGRSVGEIIDWIEKNEIGWSAHIAALEKEKRDIISGWKKGNHLPSAQSVLLFSRLNAASNDRLPHIDWDRVNALILVSRAIDFIKNESAGKVLLDEARIALWGGERNGQRRGDVRLIQNEVLSSL